MLRTQLTTSPRRLFSTSKLLLTTAKPTKMFPLHARPDTVTLTLYAKQGCSLCDKAKVIIGEVRKSPELKKKLLYQYVDITDSENDTWWDKYCFDVPVVHLERPGKTEGVKFMHYMESDKLITEINKDVE